MLKLLKPKFKVSKKTLFSDFQRISERMVNQTKIREIRGVIFGRNASVDRALSPKIYVREKNDSRKNDG